MDKGHGRHEAATVNIDPLTLLTDDTLQHMNDQYMDNPKVDLPFSHLDIAAELMTRSGIPAADIAEAKATIYSAILSKHQPKRRPIQRLRPIFITAFTILCLCSFAVACVPTLFHYAKSSYDTWSIERAGGSLTTEHAVSPYRSMEDALAEYGYSTLAPGWIPPGYALATVEVTTLHETDTVIAWYTNAEGMGISMIVCIYTGDNLDSSKTTFEVDGETNVIIENGINHYVDQNMSIMAAKWMYQRCICSLSGDITEQELEKIIASIYK